MHDRRNIAPTERLLSFGAGVLLGAAAAHLLYRGATGYCTLYAALGITTAPGREPHNPGAAVPYGTGARVEQTVSVEMAPADLYAFWRRLDTLPQFIAHVEEVTVLTPTRSRWRLQTPAGKPLTLEAEIINDVPGELIAWRSLPGSKIRHAGSVHFDRCGNATDVRVEFEYAPPGRFGAADLAESLQRFKSIAERGEICAS